MASRHPQKFKHAQPRTYSISIKDILYFPFRMCNPPPAIGKVRSCGVTPLYKVRLEDVLNRQHLPPLGLKDFEEWLLFVELSPENLYFILWLREYRLRYSQWKSQTEFQAKKAPSDFPINWTEQYSTHLAMFYARAKLTFFTPGSEYELNLTSTLLAPFHQENMSPHPGPELFVPIELETRKMLDESLRRFVTAQFNNVGTKRVLCGLVAGVIFCLVGTIPALAVNFTQQRDRWSRLAALPGLWIGLTIIFAALNGICLGVYIFGDLRQLRKFELARPTISKPQPLPAFRPHTIPPPPPLVSDSILPIEQPRKNSTAGLQPTHHRAPSVSSAISAESGHTSTQSSSSDDNIQISPAYYDADEFDTSAIYEERDNGSHYRFPAWKSPVIIEPSVKDPAALKNLFNRDADGNALAGSSDEISTYTGTATFIHPFEFAQTEEYEDAALEAPQRHQKVDTFDFESLPKRIHSRHRRPGSSWGSGPSPLPHPPHLQPLSIAAISIPRVSSSLPPTPTSLHPSSPTSPTSPSREFSPAPLLPFPAPLKLRLPDPRAPPPPSHPTSFLERFQQRCNIQKWRFQPGFFESAKPYSEDDAMRPHSSSSYWLAERNRRRKDTDPDSRAASAQRPEKASSIGGRGMNGPVTTSATSLDSSTTRSSDDRGEVEREKKAKKRFRMISGVPPFAVPLTRVLSPVILRGQWEIVVRSAIIAFALAWTVVGSLLAVPVVSKSGR